MAHVTDLGFTLDELQEAMAAGDIRRQTHPEFAELAIYNYGEEVQYRNKWYNVTLTCRGLILDTVTGEVIARPWEKFFNFGQRDNRIDFNAPVEVTDKMDGSLGILYERPDEEFAIATRGSFASEQAIAANKIWADFYAHLDVPEDYTFLFEILLPWNRIVVSYDYDSEYLQQGREVLPQRSARGEVRTGMFELSQNQDVDYTPGNLVLLGAVHKKHGSYLGPQETAGILAWPGPVTEVFHADNFASALSLPDRKGKEGYVIRSGDKIVKLKQSDYLIAHRVVTNLSPKFVWERLSTGDTTNQICDGVPDEFYTYVEELAEPLLAEFDKLRQECYDCFSNITERAGTQDRKTFALEAAKYPHRSAMFSLLDGRDIDDYLWKQVKPKFESV